VALFLDASTVVKAYVRESGSETVRSILARPETWDGLFLSELSIVEVPAAFALKRRREEINRRARVRSMGV
jgi:predicted nucleic acid-binding protein